MVPANSLSVDAIGLLRQKRHEPPARYHHAIDRSRPGASAGRCGPRRFQVLRMLSTSSSVRPWCRERLRDIDITVRREPRGLSREREGEALTPVRASAWCNRLRSLAPPASAAALEFLIHRGDEPVGARPGTGWLEPARDFRV